MNSIKNGNLTKLYNNGNYEAFSYDKLILTFNDDEVISFNYDLLTFSKTTSSHYTKAINAFCKNTGWLLDHVLHVYNTIKSIKKDDKRSIKAFVLQNNNRYNLTKKNGYYFVTYNY